MCLKNKSIWHCETPRVNALGKLWQRRGSRHRGKVSVDVIHMAQRKDGLQAPQPRHRGHVELDEGKWRCQVPLGNVVIEGLEQLLGLNNHCHVTKNRSKDDIDGSDFQQVINFTRSAYRIKTTIPLQSFSTAPKACEVRLGFFTNFCDRALSRTHLLHDTAQSRSICRSKGPTWEASPRR